MKLLGQVVSASKRNHNDFFNQINPAGFYFAHAKERIGTLLETSSSEGSPGAIAHSGSWHKYKIKDFAIIQNFQRIPRFLTFRAGKKIKNKKLSIYTSGYCQIPTSTGHVLEVKDLLL